MLLSGHGKRVAAGIMQAYSLCTPTHQLPLHKRAELVPPAQQLHGRGAGLLEAGNARAPCLAGMMQKPPLTMSSTFSPWASSHIISGV